MDHMMGALFNLITLRCVFRRVFLPFLEFWFTYS